MVDWETAELEVVNMDQFDFPPESLCTPVRPGHVLMSNFRSFATHVALCKKFHGRTTVVTGAELQEELALAAIKEAKVCSCKL